MRLLLIALALSFSGCTTIGHQPAPADWPKLAIYEHEIGCWQMVKRCYQYLSLPMKLVGGIPLACSEIDFNVNRCDIWTCALTTEGILDHEYDHCLGRDHFGDSSLKDAWQDHKAKAGKP